MSSLAVSGIAASWRGVGRGAHDLLGAVPAVVAFGLGFGAAASAAGLSTATTLAMSGFVFAGASQYAALDLWGTPLPFFGLVITTLAVNARHLVLGATLRAGFAQLSATRRYAAIAVLSDANWAATQQAAMRGEGNAAGHLVGGGLMLWIAWVAGTGVGSLAGHAIGSVERFGIDVVMPAFFACALIGMANARRDLPVWAVAGMTAWLTSLLVPNHWAVLAGTLAGGLYGVSKDARS